MLRVMPSVSLAEEALQDLVEQIENRAGGLTSLLFLAPARFSMSALAGAKNGESKRVPKPENSWLPEFLSTPTWTTLTLLLGSATTQRWAIGEGWGVWGWVIVHPYRVGLDDAVM